MELWKPLPQSPVKYEVSNTGKIRNAKSKHELSPQVHRRGHLSVYIEGEKVYVHRAVALAFIPRVPRKPLVDHIDGVKSNNHWTNLRWASAAFNTRHCVALGTHRPGGRSRPVIARDPESGEVVHAFASMTKAEIHLRGRRTGEICRAVACGYRAYGYLWAFDETTPRL